jgi:hypothetical protein
MCQFQAPQSESQQSWRHASGDVSADFSRFITAWQFVPFSVDLNGLHGVIVLTSTTAAAPVELMRRISARCICVAARTLIAQDDIGLKKAIISILSN